MTPSGQEKNGDIINIIFFWNEDEGKKGKMKLIKKNDDNKNIIKYDDIKFSFQNFLREIIEGETLNGDDEMELEFLDINDLNNIIFQYIRYLDKDGWKFLEENGKISLDEKLNLNNLEIMIKATILEKETITIQNTFEIIKEKIKSIKEQLNNIKKNDTNYFRFNSIILVANPLMDGEKELRTVNDFNIILATLYDLFKENDYDNLKYTEFSILNRESFIKAISDKQKEFFILHLICKSTYIKEENDNSENKNSSDYVNLIFEQKDNYNCDFINKEELDKIFSDPEIKENIKKIILIISTPLAEDVYNIFNNYGFKNILIQHTTPANINFVADFNLRFYENLIINRFKNLKFIYNDALNINFDEDKNTFCCCFHKHKSKCNFIKTLKNELYNSNETIKKSNNNDEKSKKDELEKLKQAIPHFSHLKPECDKGGSTHCSAFKDFCVHYFHCSDYFILDYKNENKVKDKKPYKGEKYKGELHKKFFFKKSKIKSINNGFTICCCYDEIEKGGYDEIEHNLNNIFKTNFNYEDIKEQKARIILENNYIPKYEKMPFFVGKNEDIINVLNALNEKNTNYIYMVILLSI